MFPERVRYPLLIFGYPLFILDAGVAPHWRYGSVMRFAFRLIPWLLLSVLAGSARRMDVEPITPHAITIKAERLIAPAIETAPGLRYVDGWSLSSRDRDFGGLSSLMIEDGKFVSLSDSGAVIRFGMDANGNISVASVIRCREDARVMQISVTATQNRLPAILQPELIGSALNGATSFAAATRGLPRRSDS